MKPAVGDAVMLKSGIVGTYVGVDEDSGMPLVEIPGYGIDAVHPADFEEWWDDRP